MFFDSQARISLLGEVDHASSVDNLRRRSPAIAGFDSSFLEARSMCVVTPSNRCLSEDQEPLFTSVGI